jgi:hypothetical protein
MSYRNLINSQLKNAFRMLKDLAIDTTVTRKSDSGFDFSSNSVLKPKDSNVSVKVVIVDEDEGNGKDQRKVAKTTMMIQVQEVGDINVGDTIPLNGQTYRVGPIINNDQYLLLVEAFKEG